MSRSSHPFPWINDAGPPDRSTKEVPALVKDRRLLKERRQKIIQAGVQLFTSQGFHKTTTRQIAAAAGMGVGSLYDYVRSKEDILYLVTDHIHAEVELRLRGAVHEATSGREALVQAVAAYFKVCDGLSDDILLIYQETKSLPAETRRYVLKNEVRITALFEEIITRGTADGSLRVEPEAIPLFADDIAVLGHMWTFRRWRLGKSYDLAQYTRLQTELILSRMDGSRPEGEAEGAPWAGPVPGGEETQPLEGAELESLLGSLRKF